MSIDFYAGKFTKPGRIEPVNDASVHMGERNATILFDALGIVADSQVGHMDLDKFVDIANAWIADNENAPELKIPTRMDIGLVGATVVDLGTRAGYIIERAHSIVNLLGNAKRNNGATHVYWG